MKRESEVQFFSQALFICEWSSIMNWIFHAFPSFVFQLLCSHYKLLLLFFLLLFSIECFTFYFASCSFVAGECCNCHYSIDTQPGRRELMAMDKFVCISKCMDDIFFTLHQLSALIWLNWKQWEKGLRAVRDFKSLFSVFLAFCVRP